MRSWTVSEARRSRKNHPQTENAKKKITAAMWNTCIAAVVASWKMCRVCDIMMLTKSVFAEENRMDTRCKNPRSRTTIGTFMPVYPS